MYGVYRCVLNLLSFVQGGCSSYYEFFYKKKNNQSNSCSESSVVKVSTLNFVYLALSYFSKFSITITSLNHAARGSHVLRRISKQSTSHAHMFVTIEYSYAWLTNQIAQGLSYWGEPERAPHWSWQWPTSRGMYQSIYLDACSVCLPQCSREHIYSINNT